MQPTTNQSVPATSSVSSQKVDTQTFAKQQAPIPLTADDLGQVGGGLAPNGSW